jgi:hypothetical protein
MAACKECAGRNELCMHCVGTGHEPGKAQAVVNSMRPFKPAANKASNIIGSLVTLALSAVAFPVTVKGLWKIMVWSWNLL